MESVLASGMASAVFVSTNIDNLLCLLAFFSNSAFKTSRIIVGQFTGSFFLIGVSLLCAVLGAAIPIEWIGFLGLVPIAIGLKKLWDLHKTGWKTVPGTTASVSRSQAATVAAITVCNGGDNVAAYALLFLASENHFEVAVKVATFVAMTGLLCIAGYMLVNHETVGRPIRQYGHFALPCVLIALGTYVLAGSQVLSS